ncbi:FkbM family methyltransferase [Methylobacterium sp. 13MFTsu3.1M2]|uniref:FkbM family methyltransferase n=1 Tax=Methylobacterium sp. 13MFTsu3.1M2 TaxID=1502776 RepID=UPI0008EF18FA|nr:FkbM family methyltransferase [Methylobacterium sp. 13MFTsu3.1M2]SFE66751.1 methyltransferase, FkbM family [Methylobacterium sp. 13MFTsu3.1M2]
MPPLPYGEHDIFRGYLEGDDALVSRLVAANLEPHPGVYTDQVGVRVDPSYCPWVWDKTNQVGSGLPLPSDGYIGDGMEYVALALALEWAHGQDSFVVAELGAGWGPWVSAAALCARRKGFQQTEILALEADQPRFEILRQHLALNGLVPRESANTGSSAGIVWRLMQGAVGLNDGVLYWPKSDDVTAAGRSTVSDLDKPHHFTGEDVAFEEVKAFSLNTILADLSRVDLLHVDIQGSEGTILPAAIDLLNSKVRSMFVGTHSRKIEGDFIEFFRGHGWVLTREKPCQFYSMAHGQDLTSSTYVDGGQLWRNARLFE